MPWTPRCLSPVRAPAAQRPVHTLSRPPGLALTQGGQAEAGPGLLDPEGLGEGCRCRPALSSQSWLSTVTSPGRAWPPPPAPTRPGQSRERRPSARRDTHRGRGRLPASLYSGLRQEAWGGRLSASFQPATCGGQRPAPSHRTVDTVPCGHRLHCKPRRAWGTQAYPRSICPPPPVPPQRWSRRPLRPRVRGPQARLSPGRRPHGSLPGRPSAHR